MTALSLDPDRTALVLIDLQQGVLEMSVAPHAAPDVLQRAASLAAAFRTAGALVVLVRVSFSASGADALSQPVDAPTSRAVREPGWDRLSPALAPTDRDLVITKHQWGAFYGTELDLQLRRRGVSTIVLAGIATNFGVESTARDAFERGYALVLVEDAMTSRSADAHAFAVQTIFPRLGRVRTTREVLDGLSAFSAA